MQCDCSIIDYERSDVYEDKIQKARKEHVCCECSGTIKVGDQYEYVKGLWEGTFSIYKTCIPCKSIRDRYCPHGFLFGELRNSIFECLEFDYITNEGTDDD